MREQGCLISKYFVPIAESLELTVAVYGATVLDSSAHFAENPSKTAHFQNAHGHL